MKKIFLSAAFMLLVIPAVFNSNDISAQTVSVKVGAEKEEKKKDEPKEKVVEKVVEKSGPTLEQELKKVFGMKSETSLGGRVSRISANTSSISIPVRYRLSLIIGEILSDGIFSGRMFLKIGSMMRML